MNTPHERVFLDLISDQNDQDVHFCGEFGFLVNILFLVQRIWRLSLVMILTHCDGEYVGQHWFR